MVDDVGDTRSQEERIWSHKVPLFHITGGIYKTHKQPLDTWSLSYHITFRVSHHVTFEVSTSHKCG